MRTKLSVLALLCVTLIYSIGAIGMALRVHYCMGELHSIELTYDINTPSCGCRKKTKPDLCCKDVTGYFSIEDTHSTGIGHCIPPCNSSAYSTCHFDNIIVETNSVGYAMYHAKDDPPDDPALPLYIRVRNLRH